MRKNFKPILLDETGKQIVTELQNLTKAISGGGSNNSYTGHVDVEGLKSIGWDDNDIAQFKVCWNEEQDEAFKVTDYDKWYYGYLKTTFGEGLIITDDNKANLLTEEAKTCIHFMPKVNTSSVTDMSAMFHSCNSLVSVPQFDTSSVTSMHQMFHSCDSLVSVPQFDTSSATDMSAMFHSCKSLVSVPQFDTSSATDMSAMFYNCNSLVSVPQFDTSSVTSMHQMFHSCNSLVSVPQFDTSSVTNMSAMFYNCNSLVSVPQFDTSSVTSMNYMFHSCKSLVSVPQFDTSSVTGMYQMFHSCDSLVSVPQFDTSSVTSMYQMFHSCDSLVSVPQFDTSSATDMSAMFHSCNSLVSINIGIKFANILSSTTKSLNVQTFINLIERANNTSAINQTLYMNTVAAKQLYELSCNINEGSTWMKKNDGSQSAQTWLAAQAVRTDKTHSSYAITLSFESGSSDYSGQ